MSAFSDLSRSITVDICSYRVEEQRVSKRLAPREQAIVNWFHCIGCLVSGIGVLC